MSKHLLQLLLHRNISREKDFIFHKKEILILPELINYLTETI